jgi:hypothetical protein
VLGPEPSQELLDRGEAVGVDDEQVAGALAALVDQPGFVQDLQMPGDRLRGDVEVACDIADRARSSEGLPGSGPDTRSRCRA